MPIGDLVVRIRGDNSQLDKAVDASKKQFEKVAKSAADFGRQMSNVDKLASVLGKEVNVLSEKHALLRKRIEELINSGIDPASKEIKDLAAQYKSLGTQIDQAGAKAKKLESLKTLGQTLTNIGKSMSLMVTAPIVALGIAAVKSSADMEMMEAAFTTMLGSADKAKGLLGDLREMAAATPFQLTDLADASKTLLAFGVDAEKILPTIEMLGDVSQGNSQRFQSLSLAFAQVQSTGRLMGQDLLQMVNVGFNPLQIMSEQTGKSMAELKKEMEAGAISADMVTDALRSATSEGGRFFGGMELASKTLSGLWSTLMDTMAEFGRSTADMLLPTIKDIVKTLTGWLAKFTSLDAGTKKFILGVVAVVAAIGPLILIIGKLIPIIIGLNAAIAANPLLALAAVVGVVIAAFGGYVLAQRSSHKAQEDLNRSGREQIAIQKEFIQLTGDQRMAMLLANKATVEAEIAKRKSTKTMGDQSMAVLLLQGRLETLTAEIKELTDAELNRVGGAAATALEKRLDQIEQEAKLALLIGDTYDAVGERRKALLEEINTLLDAGAHIEDAAVQKLLSDNAAILKGYADQVAAIKEQTAGEKAKADAAAEAAKAAEKEREAWVDLVTQKKAAIAADKEANNWWVLLAEKRQKVADAEILNEQLRKDEIEQIWDAYIDGIKKREEEEEALAAVEAENAAQRREFYLQQYSDSDQAVIAINEEKEAYIAAGIERAEAEAWAQAEIDRVRTEEADAEKKRIEEVAEKSQNAQKQILDAAFDVASQLIDLAQAIVDRNTEMTERAIDGMEKYKEATLDSLDAALSAAEETHETEMGYLEDQEEAYADAYDDEVERIDDLEEARREAHDAEMERIDDELDAKMDRLDAEEQAALRAAGVAEETEIEKLQSELDAAKASGDTELAFELEKQIKREQIEAEYDAKRKAAEEAAKVKKEAEEAEERAAEKAYEKEKEDREKAYEDARDAREDERRAKEDAYNAARDAAEDARADEEIRLAEGIEKAKRKLARGAAQAAKTLALFNIAINTAQAVMAALATPIVGPALAIAAGITGAIQAAIVAAQPLPELAEGGIVRPTAGGVPVTVAEAGQPEVIFPLDRLEDFVSSWPGGGGGDGGGDIHLQVMLDSRPILEKIFPATRNRTVLIDARSVV